MNTILKNKHLELSVDLPDEGYNNARFDWTGKITAVKYKGKTLSGNEISNQQDDPFSGKGFYNEFGINSPLAYKETEQGGWFHKIGIGLLKKEESEYEFHKHYTIKPADFKVDTTSNQIRILCKSDLIKGYSYLLEKEIEIQDNGFEVRYYLQNTGTKDIISNLTEINSEFFFRISVNFHVLFLSVNHLENLPKSKILNLFFFRPLQTNIITILFP